MADKEDQDRILQGLSLQHQSSSQGQCSAAAVSASVAQEDVLVGDKSHTDDIKTSEWTESTKITSEVREETKTP